MAPHKGYQRVYKRVRPEYAGPREISESKIEQRERTAAQEKRVAAELATQHRTPYSRCICGVLVRFTENVEGWRWFLEVWRGTAQRAAIAPRGPYPTRPAAVKDAAKFVSSVVRSTRGTVDLMKALCQGEENG